MKYLSVFDVTTEYVMLVCCGIFLYIIKFMKPKKTSLLQICKQGFEYGIMAIISQEIMFYYSCETYKYAKVGSIIFYIIYSVFYSLTLLNAFIYINMLSYGRRKQMMKLKKMFIFFFVLFMSIMMYPVISNQLLIEIKDGFILTSWYKIYIFCGLLGIVFCMASVVANYNTISKNIYRGSIIFIVIDLMALCSQVYFLDSIFTSFTYVMPFVLFFILFHCSNFDEVTGCQSMDSLDAMLSEAFGNGNKYVLIYVSFPQLQKREYDNIKSNLALTCSTVCREIERIQKGFHLYSGNIYTYAGFCYVKNEEQKNEMIKKVQYLLNNISNCDNNEMNYIYKMIVVTQNEIINTIEHMHSFWGYQKSKFHNSLERECIISTESDYLKYKEYHEIEKILNEIKNDEDLDDERVLCYAQPIYCFKSDSYKTAEALMRLQYDGKIFYPDQFIGIAEHNGSIHVLTCIMFNKVCKLIKKIEKGYQFEAITINCSTIDLADRNLYQELEQIIKLNDVNPDYIRIEITESTTISSYDTIKMNMERLGKTGIQFYLDDFGTGYSNLERIIKYPFQTIKFDKSILYNALESEKADSLLSTLIGFFNSYGYNTVIEGVEDMHQIDYVREKGFAYIQGYAFSKPIPIEELTVFFLKNSAKI